MPQHHCCPFLLYLTAFASVRAKRGRRGLHPSPFHSPCPYGRGVEGGRAASLPPLFYLTDGRPPMPGRGGGGGQPPFAFRKRRGGGGAGGGRKGCTREGRGGWG